MKLKKALSKIVASVLAASMTVSGAIPASAATTTISMGGKYKQPSLIKTAGLTPTSTGIAGEHFHLDNSPYYMPYYIFGNSSTYGFCVQPSVTSGATDSGTTISTKEATTFWNKVKQKDGMSNAYGLAMYYGYPNTSTGLDYYVATQLILWEITMGYRDYTPHGTYETSQSLLGHVDYNSGICYTNKTAVEKAYKAIEDGMSNAYSQPSSSGNVWSKTSETSVSTSTIPVLYDYSTNTWRTQTGKLNIKTSDLNKEGFNWSTIPTGLKNFAEAQNVKGSVSTSTSGNYTQYKLSWNKKPFSGGSVKNTDAIDLNMPAAIQKSWVIWAVDDKHQTMVTQPSMDPEHTSASFIIPNYADIPIQKYWQIDDQTIKGSAAKDYMSEVYWYARIGDKDDAVVDGTTKYIVADVYESNGVKNYVFQGTTTDRSKATKFKIDVDNYNGTYGYNATTGYGKTIIYDVPCDFTESGTKVTPKSIKVTLEEYLPDGGKAITAGFKTKYSDGTRKRATVTVPTFSTSTYKAASSPSSASFKNALNPKYTHVSLEKEVVSTDKDDLTTSNLAKAYKDMKFVAFYFDGNQIKYLKNLSADGNVKDGSYEASASVQGTEYAFNSNGLTTDITQAQRLTPGYADASGNEITSNSQNPGTHFGEIFIDKIPIGARIGFIEMQSGKTYGYDEDQKEIITFSSLINYMKNKSHTSWTVVKYDGVTTTNGFTNNKLYPVVVSAATTSEKDTSVSIVNQPYYFNATVLKRDDDNHPLDETVIGLYTSESATKPIETQTTNPKGEVTFETKMTSGDVYYYQEITPKAGYIADSTRYKVNTTITVNEIKNAYLGTQVQDGILVNHPTETYFYKKDVDNKTVVGAKLRVKDTDGNVIDTWTTKQGDTKHTIEGLVVGKTYIYEEIEAPEGYIKASPIRFTVKASGKTSVTMENVQTETYVSKRDITGEDELPGATLIVTDKDGNELDRWVSGDKPHTIMGLAIGQTYTLTEITAPDGYTVSESIEFTINEDGTTRVEMTDTPTSIHISKKDITGKDELAGATLIVTDANGNEVDRWVSGRQPHQITKILVDKVYTLTEVTAPDGYVVAESIYFKVDDHNNVTVSNSANGTFTAPEDGKVTMKDKPTTTYFSKKDITNSEELPGATLVVTDAEGNEIDKWVSTTEVHLIEKLVVGQTYTLTEITAPDGYTRATSVEFTVNRNGITQVEMKDSPTTVHLSKKDVTNKEELPGATLVVTDMDGNEIDKWVSTTEPHIITKVLVDHVYTLTEITAPDGYVKAESIFFKVDDQNNVTVCNTADGEFVAPENGVVTMEDKPTETYFTKKSITNNEELPGATLIVTDTEGNEIDKWVSTTEPHIITKLVVGHTYILTEITAPDGYVKAESIEFVVNENGVTHIEMFDKPTEIYISKKDITDENELEGATLIVSDLDDNEIDKWESGNEPHVIYGLVAGQVYKLTELTAPDGYVVAETIFFQVDDQNNVTVCDTADGEFKSVEEAKVTMEDKPTETYFTKKDITNSEELEGATLIVTDEEGNEIDKWVSTKEPHLITKLVVGHTYTLTEITAPDGYIKAESVTFVVNENGVTHVEMFDKPTETYISKIDVTNKEELEGATLELYDEEGNLIETWVSGKEPHVVYHLVIGKTYKLVEKTSPNGYVVAESVTFTIDEDGVTEVTMKDDYTKIEILKVDGAGNPVAGAKLQILDKDNNVIASWTSTTEPYRIDKLIVGETYTLHEVSAPEGYELAPDQTFKVGNTAEVVKIEMTDKVKTPNPNTGATSSMGAAIAICGALVIFLAKKKED